MPKRLNKFCAYFPCHQALEDCTFCYCPFYPCGNKSLGEYLYSKKTKKNIWSCSNCNWIHKRSVVNDIFALIRQSFEPVDINQKLKNLKTAIIILSHGSRLKKVKKTINRIIGLIKEKLAYSNIVPAYLQLSEPDLTKSIKNLVGKGSTRIIIVPFFLFNGNHVSRDIPREIKKEAAKYPKIKFITTKNLRSSGRLADIVVKRIKEALLNATDN